jgi:hypothetical protein
MSLSRQERIRDLVEFHGVVWVESPTEMLSRLSPAQRVVFDGLRSEQLFLLERGKPSPGLDRVLAREDMDPRVAYAITNRRLLRRALNGT